MQITVHRCATGHAHAITDNIQLLEKDGVLYMVNDHPVELVHEEHGPHTIEPGAESAVRTLYAQAGQAKPRIIWLPCPVSGCLANVFLQSAYQCTATDVARSAVHGTAFPFPSILYPCLGIAPLLPL
jgi:hypothetical protein